MFSRSQGRAIGARLRMPSHQGTNRPRPPDMETTLRHCLLLQEFLDEVQKQPAAFRSLVREQRVLAACHHVKSFPILCFDSWLLRSE
eukprot:1352972-Amphidinium_carterae.1